MKRNWRAMAGCILCISLVAGEVSPLLALAKEENTQNNPVEMQAISPEEPAKWQMTYAAKSGLPVGGVNSIEITEISAEDGGQVPILAADTKECVSRQTIDGSHVGTYGYSTLSTTEKAVYKLLHTAMENFDQSSKSAERRYSYGTAYYLAGKVNVKKYQLSKRQMERIYFALEADYLEFYWLDDSIGYTTTNGFTMDEWYIMVEPDYWDYTVRKAAKNNIKRGMVPFLEKIDNAKAAGASQLELELLIHDMIIEEVDYAYNIWRQPETAAYAHTIVGVFDNNKNTDVVCEGYAKAFQFLCGYAGLESIYAVGWSTSGNSSGGHAWNLVKLNGNWYNVDTTWDDSNGSDYDGYQYDYFNLPTSVFNEGKAHDYRADIYGGMYTVPNATATAAGYYNYYGLNITAGDFSSKTSLQQFMDHAIAGCEQRKDYLLRLHCKDDATATALSDSLNFNKELWKEAVSGASTNGRTYEIESVAFDSQNNNLLLYISKIGVENITNGYTFGDPHTQVVVNQWSGRNATEITSACTLAWGTSAGKESLSVKKDGSHIGVYTYTLVAPQVEKIGSYTYTSEGICPKVTVKVGRLTLKQGEDYQVQYSNNINVGTAKIRITGMGNYSGYTEQGFQIKSDSLTNLAASVTTSQFSYDGRKKTPKVTVKDKGNTLAEGVDYSLSYENNSKIGTAYVVVKGKGNYQGTKKLKFYIVPKKVTNVKLSAGKGKTLKFSFDKVSGAAGYQLALYHKGKNIKTVTTTKNSYQFQQLKENQVYTVKVRAYINPDGKRYGEYSSELQVKTATKAPVWTKTTLNQQKVMLQWKKITKASGYEVYMSRKAKSGYKKVVSLSGSGKTKYVQKGLTSGKTYYFKVRTFTKKGKYKSYSSYSPVQRVTVK